MLFPDCLSFSLLRSDVVLVKSSFIYGGVHRLKLRARGLPLRLSLSVSLLGVSNRKHALKTIHSKLR